MQCAKTALAHLSDLVFFDDDSWIIRRRRYLSHKEKFMQVSGIAGSYHFCQTCGTVLGHLNQQQWDGALRMFLHDVIDAYIELFEFLALERKLFRS